MTSVYNPNEQFAGNLSINADLHEILGRTSEPSLSRMLKELRANLKTLEKNEDEQADKSARHTFREFLLGDRLNRAGYCLEYDPIIDGKTPDWYDESNKLIIEVFTCEIGAGNELGKRVADKVATKVMRYKKIVDALSVRFVVAVHGVFETCLDEIDCEDLIAEYKLFNRFSGLSGVIYFGEECSQRVAGHDGSTCMKQLYSYHFIANSSAEHAIDLSESLQDS